MFGWFKRKKKPEAVHPAFEPKQYKTYVNPYAGTSQKDDTPKQDTALDLLTSPAYMWMPGNVFHSMVEPHHIDTSNSTVCDPSVQSSFDTGSSSYDSGSSSSCDSGSGGSSGDN
jgi:uncharacterized membrane protein YgcG